MSSARLALLAVVGVVLMPQLLGATENGSFLDRVRQRLRRGRAESHTGRRGRPTSWMGLTVPPRPGEDFTNGTGMRMVWIPPGSFMMGEGRDDAAGDPSGFPKHRVVVGEGFWIGQLEVTQKEYRQVTAKNPSRFQDDVQAPVERVNWFGATDFCRRLTALEEGAVRYELPTEAQWEYVCRAGTTTAFSFGSSIGVDQVNFWDDARRADLPRRPVRGGTFPANEFGVYNMHGNVREWCRDRWHATYDGAPADSRPWLAGGRRYRVIRGGSWGTHDQRYARSARRSWFSPESYNGLLGFRVVAERRGSR